MAKDGRAAGRARLFALDLDGTLLTGGNRVGDEDAAAVREAVAAGVHIVFATSRWYRLAKRTADHLGVTSPIICHNGAMVRDPRTDERWLSLTVPPEPSREIAEIADAARYESMVTVDDVTHMITKRADIDATRLPGGMALTERLGAHVGGGCDGFLFFGQDAVDGLLGALGTRYDGVLNLAHGYSETFPPYLNIVHAAADKGRALLLVCERLGIDPRDAVAMGDAAPDLEMMRVAGTSVAMGNAPPEVQREATAVAPGNLHAGVAWALREFAL